MNEQILAEIDELLDKFDIDIVDKCAGVALMRDSVLRLRDQIVSQDAMFPKTQLEHTTETLANVHDKSECAGRPCCIHNRTDHSMRQFPQHYRTDRGIMERICPHGVGHPDPDDMAWRSDSYYQGIHGCDGCCG